MRVAIDIEETVADVDKALLESWNFWHGTDYTKSDMVSWDWVEYELDYDEFMETVDELWEYAPHTIEKLDKAAPVVINRLGREVEKVDFVTARPGVEKSMQHWLDYHNFRNYGGLIAIEPNDSKARLNYDVYIDDNPKLVGYLEEEQFQYIIEKPYNEGVFSGGNVQRVGNVTEAILRILHER